MLSSASTIHIHAGTSSSTARENGSRGIAAQLHLLVFVFLFFCICASISQDLCCICDCISCMHFMHLFFLYSFGRNKSDLIASTLPPLLHLHLFNRDHRYSNFLLFRLRKYLTSSCKLLSVTCNCEFCILFLWICVFLHFFCSCYTLVRIKWERGVNGEKWGLQFWRRWCTNANVQHQSFSSPSS